MTDPSPLSRVTIVSVCYNSTAVLPQMLASVPGGVAVVLVDNASGDAAALADLAARHGARLLGNGSNIGFGAACNRGAADATTDFLLFLNPDACLTPGAIEALVAAADRYPAASAFNPRIEAANGREYFRRGTPFLPRSTRLPRGWPAADREVPVLSGAALFVRRSAFRAVGGFDPAIFLYHEDDDLSLRLAHSAGPLMFVRDALVRHAGGRSSARTAEIAALKGWHMGRSRVYVARKQKLQFAVVRTLFVALLQLTSPLVILSPRKRAKQASFLKGALSTLVDR